MILKSKTSPKASAERRRHIRAKRNLTIEHRLYKHKGVVVNGVWRSSKTENMSLVGVLFNSDIPYHIGDILEARVVMLGLDIFRGYGRVVRTDEEKSKKLFLIAIAFLDAKSAYVKSPR